jgi:hypothetical protein
MLILLLFSFCLFTHHSNVNSTIAIKYCIMQLNLKSILKLVKLTCEHSFNQPNMILIVRSHLECSALVEKNNAF